MMKINNDKQSRKGKKKYRGLFNFWNHIYINFECFSGFQITFIFSSDF